MENIEKQVEWIVENFSHNPQEASERICSLLGVSNSLEQTIYVTNSSPHDVYAAFDSKNRSEIETEESGCYMTEITLYKGERL